MHGAMPPLPHMSVWHSACLRTGDNLPLPFLKVTHMGS